MPEPDENSSGRPAAADVAASPQLSIERLMGQLVKRASDTITSQQRVQALSTANQSIVGDASGARYAALGVIGPDGTLEQFVHTGMDAVTVRDIGHLPKWDRRDLGPWLRRRAPPPSVGTGASAGPPGASLPRGFFARRSECRLAPEFGAAESEQRRARLSGKETAQLAT